MRLGLWQCCLHKQWPLDQTLTLRVLVTCRPAGAKSETVLMIAEVRRKSFGCQTDGRFFWACLTHSTAVLFALYGYSAHLNTIYWSAAVSERNHLGQREKIPHTCLKLATRTFFNWKTTFQSKKIFLRSGWEYYGWELKMSLGDENVKLLHSGVA